MSVALALSPGESITLGGTIEIYLHAIREGDEKVVLLVGAPDHLSVRRTDHLAVDPADDEPGAGDL